MRFVAGKGVVAERHREDAGRGAVAAEMLLAGRCWPGLYGGAFAGRGAVTERHREEACQGAVAERHREEACQGTVAVEMLLAGRCWPRRRG